MTGTPSPRPPEPAADATPTLAGPLPPGAWVGVFGGGQLGRMFVHAAQRLGYHVRVFSDQAGSPAGQAADHEQVGEYSDPQAVEEFARSVDAATLEFENVPTEGVRLAERLTVVRPGGHVLHTTQHRVREKRFLQEAGVPVGPFAPVGSLESLRTAAKAIGLPAVLKTAELGYDGKGQRVAREADDLEQAWRELGPGECVLEKFVDFAREVSVLVARGADGACATYGPIENRHANHILDLSVYPAPTTREGAPERARQIATAVAEALGVVGLVCVELFELPDGELLVNEIAPRTHNSGHLTIEGCRTSQFEQQARAVCGLPLGPTDSVRPAAMANLLGDLWFGEGDSAVEPNWAAALGCGVSLHLYGKQTPKRGRKMGHLTALADSPAEAAALAARARAALRPPPR